MCLVAIVTTQAADKQMDLFGPVVPGTTPPRWKAWQQGAAEAPEEEENRNLASLT